MPKGRADSCCRHLEIETHTREVRPAGLKMDLLDSLEREYRWPLAALGLPNP